MIVEFDMSLLDSFSSLDLVLNSAAMVSYISGQKSSSAQEILVKI